MGTGIDVDVARAERARRTLIADLQRTVVDCGTTAEGIVGRDDERAGVALCQGAGVGNQRADRATEQPGPSVARVFAWAA